jgi:hypothetical protein
MHACIFSFILFVVTYEPLEPGMEILYGQRSQMYSHILYTMFYVI